MVAGVRYQQQSIEPSTGELRRAEREARRILDAPDSLASLASGDDLLSLFIDDLSRETRSRFGSTPLADAAIMCAKGGDTQGLVLSGMPFALRQAMRYNQSRGRSIMDLVQEANLGVMRAAKNFDYRRGFAFTTYCFWWVRRMLNYEADRQDVPLGLLPSQEHKTLKNVRRRRIMLERTLGRQVSLAETVNWLTREQVPTPKFMRGKHPQWPSPAEIMEWEAVATGIKYLSQIAPPSVMSDTLTSREIVLEGALASTHNTEDEALANLEVHEPTMEIPTAAGMRSLLFTCMSHGQIDSHECTLLVLRVGAPHPDLNWEPPQNWQLGNLHSFAMIAGMLGSKRASTQRHITQLLARLACSPDPAARRLHEAVALAPSYLFYAR